MDSVGLATNETKYTDMFLPLDLMSANSNVLPIISHIRENLLLSYFQAQHICSYLLFIVPNDAQFNHLIIIPKIHFYI